MRFRHVLVLSAIGCWAIFSASAPAQVTTSSAPATMASTAPSDPEALIAWIKKMGGKVEREGDRPDGPIRSVSLNGSAIKDADLPALLSLKPKYLILGKTPVTDAGLEIIGQAKDLEMIDLENTRVTAAGFRHLANLERLDLLNVSQTKFDDVALHAISGLKALRFLFMSNTLVTDKGLEEVGSLRNLEYLYCGQNKITDVGLRNLTNLPRLRGLYIADTETTDEGIRALRKISTLQELGIDGTKVTEKALADIGEMRGLSALSIGLPSISDEALANLTKLKSLENLYIFGRITDTGLRTIAGLPRNLLFFNPEDVTVAGIRQLKEAPNLNQAWFASHATPSPEKHKALTEVNEFLKARREGKSMTTAPAPSPN